MCVSAAGEPSTRFKPHCPAIYCLLHPRGAWLTPASVRLHMCGTGAAYRQNVREFNPPCEIGTAKNRSRSRYRLHGLGLCAPALHWHLMSRGGGMTKGAQTADRDQTDKPWPWPALFQWLRPAAFDPDQGRRPNHPVKLNHHMEQEVRRAAMPVSPYLRSPARTLREACHEVNRDNQGRLCADCPLADLCEREYRRKQHATAQLI